MAESRSRSVGMLRERLELVLSSVDPRAERLSAAGTSVTFVVRDEPDATVTVLLDRHPPVVVTGSEPAEITIEFTRDGAARFARGELTLVTEMLAGDVPYRGPVRKYLTVDPVLRSLLASLDSGRLRG